MNFPINRWCSLHYQLSKHLLELVFSQYLQDVQEKEYLTLTCLFLRHPELWCHRSLIVSANCEGKLIKFFLVSFNTQRSLPSQPVVFHLEFLFQGKKKINLLDWSTAIRVKHGRSQTESIVYYSQREYEGKQGREYFSKLRLEGKLS